MCGLNDGLFKQKGNQMSPCLISMSVTELFVVLIISRSDSNFDSQVKRVALGDYHVVVLTKSGTVYTWGANLHGQLGHGNFVPLSEPKALTLVNVKDVRTVFNDPRI